MDLHRIRIYYVRYEYYKYSEILHYVTIHQTHLCEALRNHKINNFKKPMLHLH